MATPLDQSIRLSVEDTNGFIDISRGKTKKERNEERRWEGEKPPIPYYEPVTNQIRGAEPDDQISKIWKNITENLLQFGEISWDLLHRLYKCCLEEPNVCELLLLLLLRCCRCAKGSSRLIVVVARWGFLKIVGCFTKKIFCHENKNIHGTGSNETRILMDDDDDDDGCQGTF